MSDTSRTSDITSGRAGEDGLSRRTFLALGTGALLVAVAPGAPWRPRRRLHRRTIPVMGTLAEVAVVEDDPARARVAIEAALGELRRVEADMTRFEATSDVGRINAARVGVRVPVEAATAGVLAAGLRWARATDGRFDPGLARAVALWDVGHRRVPPPAEAVRRYAGRDLYRELEVADPPAGGAGSGGAASAVARPGTQASVVRLHADVAVDLGGIGKGHAVDRAVGALRAHGIRAGMVNAGGDLYALGRSPDGDAWRVGVRSPDDPTRLVGELEVTDRAVATSGDYERYFEHDGLRYHHLLDPATGAPRRGPDHSLTVTADRCLTADAAATACFGLAREEARRLLSGTAPDAALV